MERQMPHADLALVPRRPTEAMLLAGYQTVAPDQLLVSAWQAMIEAVPAEPRADSSRDIESLLLDEMNRRFGLRKMIDDDWLCIDDTQLGVEFAAEFVAPHFASMEAEICRLKARIAELESAA